MNPSSEVGDALGHENRPFKTGSFENAHLPASRGSFYRFKKS